MSRASTIIPPPSDFPVPMPEVAAEAREVPASDSWRLLVELTKETVRPPSREREPSGEFEREPSGEFERIERRDP
jgi:hypothetical protein